MRPLLAEGAGINELTAVGLRGVWVCARSIPGVISATTKTRCTSTDNGPVSHSVRTARVVYIYIYLRTSIISLGVPSNALLLSFGEITNFCSSPSLCIRHPPVIPGGTKAFVFYHRLVATSAEFVM